MGAVTPAIAISTSIATALLAAFFGLFVAMRSRKTALRRDTIVSVFLGSAILLIILNVVAAAFVAAWGMAYVGLVQATLRLTAAFAVAGMVVGLQRGLRSRAFKT